MCPHKFQYLYIEKRKSTSSPQAQRGIEVHKFCNEFYDNLTFKNGDYTVNAEFLEAWFDTCLNDTKPYLENFLQFEKQRWEVCKQLLPQDAKKLFIPILREAKYSSDKLCQVTIVDRLDLRVDGNYTLVEIKTEKYNPKGWKDTEFRREMTFEKNTIESATEFQQKFPKDIVDFVVYFPRANDVMMENFNWRSAQALNKALEKMRADIDNSYYPCRVDYHCRFCPFSLECDFQLSR